VFIRLIRLTWARAHSHRRRPGRTVNPLRSEELRLGAVDLPAATTQHQVSELGVVASRVEASTV
jgi:hypothetical protein